MIDALLNKITTYRLIVYYLAALLVLGALFGALGWIPVSPFAVCETTVVLLAVTVAGNFLFARIFRVWANQESTIITALILALIMGPVSLFTEPKRMAIVALSGLVAIASKYLIAFRRHHIFNPAAFGVFVSGLAFGEYASWWVGQEVLLPAVILGGLLIIRKINRLRFTAIFAAAFAVFLFGYGLLQGLPPDQAVGNLGFVFLQTEVFFLAFVMLPEPITSPKRLRFQLLYILVAAALLLPQLSILGISFSPEMALLVANLVGFIVSPKGRHRLVLRERKMLGNQIESYSFASPEGLRYKPGQYMEWTLPLSRADSRGNRRYLSLASSPTESEILIAARIPEKHSAFKARLASMKPGDSILAAEVSGDFVLPRKKEEKLAMIAGGIGITPFRSMLKYLADSGEKRDLALIYSNYAPDDIAFDDTLCEAQRVLGAKVVHTLTDVERAPRDWNGEKGLVDARMISRNLPDYGQRTFYVSGAPGFVDTVEKSLRSLGVRRGKIRTDFFSGY